MSLTLGITSSSQTTLWKNFKNVDRLIFFRKFLVGLVPFLSPVRNCYDAYWAYPAHSLDIAVLDPTIVGSWKFVELSFIAPGPLRFVQVSNPKHRVHLRDDRHAPAIDGHA